MSVPFREPYFTREELIEVITDHYRVEPLHALETAIGQPGERLWLVEEAGEVYRVWHKGRGKRARWTWGIEHALAAEVRMAEQLAGTVLARLSRPDRSRDYALQPGMEEDDLEVLRELERVWLSGARNPPLLMQVEWQCEEQPLLADRQICDRIRRLEGELGRARALRARNLMRSYGTGPMAVDQVAVTLGCDSQDADEILGARNRYAAWAREGAAVARSTIPVHRPAGPTGLPDDWATRLMTAACHSEQVIRDRPHPRPLPPELAPWHVYIGGLGHCVAVAVEGLYEPAADPWYYMTVAPVRLVLDSPWTVQDGIVVAEIPYDTDPGAAICEDSDLEFSDPEGDVLVDS